MPVSIVLDAGTLLIASLNLESQSFRRSVVLLLKHNDEGTVGVVVNRPLGERINLYSSGELMQYTCNLGGPEPTPRELGSMFFQGGPVEPGTLVFLHRLEHLSKDGTQPTEVCGGLYLGGDLETIREHTAVTDVERPVLRFYLGYAGWNPGQLENEIAQGAWHLCPGNVDLVLEPHPDKVWQQAVYGLGGKYRPMSFIPEDVSIN